MRTDYVKMHEAASATLMLLLLLLELNCHCHCLADAVLRVW